MKSTFLIFKSVSRSSLRMLRLKLSLYDRLAKILIDSKTPSCAIEHSGTLKVECEGTISFPRKSLHVMMTTIATVLAEESEVQKSIVPIFRFSSKVFTEENRCYHPQVRNSLPISRHLPFVPNLDIGANIQV